MTGAYSVDPSALVSAGAAVSRDAGPVSEAASGVAATSGAAQGTPAAAAYSTLLGEAAKSLTSVHRAVEDLGGALTQAAANYADAESTNTTGIEARLR